MAISQGAHLGGGIVQNSWLGHVGVDGADIYNGAAFGHVLNTLLGHAEIGDDVGLEGELQALPAELSKVIHHRTLVGRVVNKDVHLAPLGHSLVNNVPAGPVHKA